MKFVLIAIAVIYFILPWDLIPDAAGLFGRVDEVLLFAFLLRYYWRRQMMRSLSEEEGEKENEGAQRTRQSNSEKYSPHEKKEEVDPYKILGLQRDASSEEVRAAFKREAAKYHPDKVSHLGKELQQLAHQRMLAIKDAYELLSSRGKK